MLKKGPTTVMARHVKQEEYSSRSSAPKEIGLEVTDPKTRKKYVRGKFLGKVSNRIYTSLPIRNDFLTKIMQRHPWKINCIFFRQSSVYLTCKF